MKGIIIDSGWFVTNQHIDTTLVTVQSLSELKKQSRLIKKQKQNDWCHVTVSHITEKDFDIPDWKFWRSKDTIRRILVAHWNGGSRKIAVYESDDPKYDILKVRYGESFVNIQRKDFYERV